MTNANLHIFAINMPTDVRHTYLSRAQSLPADLPDLVGWLGVDGLNTDEIELFPLDDLGDMLLSDYIATAFDVDPVALKSAAARLNALEGSVLLVPDTALDGAAQPGPQASFIASLPVLQPDHSADGLPKADMSRPPADPDPATATPENAGVGRTVAIAVIMAMLAALSLWWLFS